MQDTPRKNIIELAPGLFYGPGWLDGHAQHALANEIGHILEQAPLFQPRMPKTGKPFSVRMTNCGPLGWVSDAAGGYRYQPLHPDTGRPWPKIPDVVLKAWEELGHYEAEPEACLINFYDKGTRMGLHQDRDEADFSAPVVSLSLGDTGLFRFGGLNRKDPTRSIRLGSGDVLVMSGPSRLCFHGIDRVLAGSSALLEQGGRINLTLRRVT